MAITHKYTLICDEVRQEANGKLIVIGLYTPDIVIPQIPFALPSLTFFLSLESDRAGHFGLHLKLQHLESGQTLVEGHGGIIFQRPGAGSSQLRFGNLQFNAAGAYNLSVEIDGQPDPILTPFAVVLRIPPQQQGGRTFPTMH